MTKYRVLSLDGGGIRGVVTTILLQRITATPGLENFLDAVDLIAGTSTGGMLALALATPIDLARIRNLYIEQGPIVFADTLLDDIVDLGKVRGADYDTEPLRHQLDEIIGDATLGDLTKRVLITAFDLDNEAPANRTWKPKLFHNFPGPNTDRDIRVVDAALYTQAAPTFFPSVDGYIDGGVYATNPSMCALAQTQDTRYDPTPALDDVLLLSLGTGMTLQYVEGSVHDWGYIQWAKPLVNLMLEGTASIADYQCYQMLRERYHRLAPIFPEGVNLPLDAVDGIPFMVDFAEAWPIDETIDWLLQTWNAPD